MKRRHKRIFITTLLLTVPFLLVSWHLWKPEEIPMYIPGSQIEGVTTKLTREVPPEYTAINFKDVSKISGINFYHFDNIRSSQLPEDMGSGVAWFDYNNDGWDDLFIVNFASQLDQAKDQNTCSLYENNKDGTFTNVSKEAGVDLVINGMGVATGDYDNDGWTDLFVTSYGTNHLLKNNGDQTFSDVSLQSGVGDVNGFWAGASWGDYDKDGYIDLYVTGYVKYMNLNLGIEDLKTEEPSSINPSTFRPERNLLYHNNGDGTFTESSRYAGVENLTGRSLSAAWIDLNNDMWPDLYVANDVSDNVLYLNNGDGTFKDISHDAHVADYRGAMGIASGDWDNDQDPDLFVTHWIAQENALYNNLWYDPISGKNSNQIAFTDDSDIYGLGQSSLDFVGWATSFVDFDLDTRLDLFVVNGSTSQSSSDHTKLQPMKSQIFWNAGSNNGFYDVSEVSGNYFGREEVGRCGAYSDYDLDGDPDLYIVNHNSKGVLLKNDNDAGRHWLSVRLEGRQSNRSAIGTKLRLVCDESAQIREVGSQSSYLSQNTLVQHFGLNNYDIIDTLKIFWPSGQIDLFVNLATNQTIKVIEGQTEISLETNKNL